ncbi:MAG: site-specific DNA-methyltransferase, partial [Polyangiaceae bacterium]|nr:site-specific DNA-methyltransferase [Polyangiaceae bacterium]
FVWQKRTTRENRKVFSVNHDYIVCYARSKEHFQGARNMLPLNEGVLSRYDNPDNDTRGEWQSVSLNAQAGHATRAQFYKVRTPSGRIVELPPGRCWVVTKDKMDELIADNRVWFGPTGDNVPRRKIFLSEAKDGLTPHTLWLADEVGTNDSAKKDLIKLFDGVEAYDTPKPVELIRRIVQIGTSKEAGELVLDFFAGSGTTAEAVLRANEADGGRRTFLLVQLPEPIAEDKQAALSGCRTISEVCRQRITRALSRIESERNGKFEATNNKGVLGFRSFRLTSSNFKIWDGSATPRDSDKLMEQIRLFADNIIPGRSREAILCELLLKAGLPLTARIETQEILGATVYSIATDLLFICLDDPIKREVLRGMMELKPQRILCLDHAFRGNDKDKVNTLLEMRSRDIEFRTI